MIRSYTAQGKSVLKKCCKIRFWNHEILVTFKHALWIQISMKTPGFRLKLFANASHTNTQKEEKRTCFCTFQERSSCVSTRLCNVLHFVTVGIVYNFSSFCWKTKVDLNKTNIPRLLTHHGESLSKRWGKTIFQACAKFLWFHFGDILSYNLYDLNFLFV